MKTESGPRSSRLNVWHCWWRLFGELLLGRLRQASKDGVRRSACCEMLWRSVQETSCHTSAEMNLLKTPTFIYTHEGSKRNLFDILSTTFIVGCSPARTRVQRYQQGCTLVHQNSQHRDLWRDCSSITRQCCQVMKTESGPRSNRLNVWHCWWRLFGELLLGSQAKFCTPTGHMQSILAWWPKQAPIQSTSCCKRMHEVQWNIPKRCQSMPTRISWKSRCPNWAPRLWHWRGLLCWRFLS